MVKDVLFPVFCAGCRVEGFTLCEKCLREVEFLQNQTCPVCGIKNDNGGVCAKCRAVSSLDGVTAFFNYDDSGMIAALIKDFKYGYVMENKDAFARLVRRGADLLRRSLPAQKEIVVTAAPLHPRRERERGFNQSQIIAEIVAQALELKINGGILKRTINTKHQASLSGDARRKNLRNAFAVSDDCVVPETILLVDDVFTTGATLQECARVLKQNSAATVWGFALARG